MTTVQLKRGEQRADTEEADWALLAAASAHSFNSKSNKMNVHWFPLKPYFDVKVEDNWECGNV